MSTARNKDKEAARKKPLRLRVHTALRWLHIYISMFSLLAILFFSITGLTLNHPEWAFTNTETKRETKGQLPDGWKNGKDVDWFRVVEHLRAKDGVKGSVAEKEADESEGTVTFKAPGYNADCFFDAEKGSYDLTITTYGFSGMMNDFHRGREGGTGWKLLIDATSIMLTTVALTGLGLLWYLKRMRTAAFIAMGVGFLFIVILMRLAF